MFPFQAMVEVSIIISRLYIKILKTITKTAIFTAGKFDAEWNER